MVTVSPATIFQIAKILVDYKICRDNHPLLEGINKKSDVLSVNKFELLINDIPRGTHPSSVKNLKALLTMEVPKNSQDDLNFTKYNYSVVFSGISDGNTVKSSFHLDYDSDVEDTEYTHPFFHLTYGGKMMEGTNLGDVLLLPAPRIPFPPLDIVLGIDFILSNFLKRNMYEKLLEESIYRKAVKDAQEKYWKPYFLTIANHWYKCPNADFGTAKKYLPTLV